MSEERNVDTKWEWIFGILALVLALFQFIAAATGGPVQDVFSGIFAASSGCVVLYLVGKLRGW